MRVIIIIFLSVALTGAQFPFATNELVSPWSGPVANHQIGQPPGDTPEVAAAKQAHLKAFKEVLAVLPELPPEERYRKTGLPLSAVLALMQRAYEQNIVPREPFVHHGQSNVVPNPQVNVPVFIPHQQQHIPQPALEFNVELSKRPVYTVFAEDIPRSPYGEVPEVYAARIAHLKAYEEARNLASQGR